MGREAVAGVETLSLTDREQGAACRLLPELGATVWRLSLAATNVGAAGDPGTGADTAAAAVLAADTPEEIVGNPWFRGRILFPFNDRIPAGRYRFDGREYRLSVNDPDSGCALHGLVYDRPFAVAEVAADNARAAVTLVRDLSPEDAPGYPFGMRLEVRVALAADGFTLELTARNVGDRAAPVALGWHPYIALPGGVDTARLTCPAARFVEVDEELLPTGRRPAVTGGPLDFASPRPIGSRELDIALERAPAVSPSSPGGEGPLRVAATVVDRGADRIVIEQSLQPFGFTQLFIPPGRTSIAVEPVTAATDAFNRPALGRADLAPAETLTGWVRLRRTAGVQAGV